MPSSSALASLTTILLILLSLTIVYGECDHYNFNVSDTVNGPLGWGSMCADYQLCGSGSFQSPVNIVTSGIAESRVQADLGFPRRTGVLFSNNGHTIGTSANITLPDTVVYGGPLSGRYTLIGLHFHGSSDHTINGKQYALELHMVFSNNGNLAVVSFLHDVGGESSFLSSLVGVAGALKSPGTFVTVPVVPFDMLSPGVTSFYSYPGSLTVPPCTEGVTWLISSNILTATQAQIDALGAGAGAPGNFRPTQQLGTRQITRYNNVTTVTGMSSNALKLGISSILVLVFGLLMMI